eukprot:scaffold694_cov338-Pavlova_lutheri.AAC.10
MSNGDAVLSSCEAWMPFPGPSFPFVESVRANPLSMWATFSAIGGLVGRSGRFPRDGSRWQDRLGRPQAVRTPGSHHPSRNRWVTRGRCGEDIGGSVGRA